MAHYLLDSNIFIRSPFLGYRFSFYGGFQELLRTLHDVGRVSSTRAVKYELTKKDDELVQWIKTLPDDFFRDERTRETQIRHAELISWAANDLQFTDAAKDKFASEHADPWLVSYAATNGIEIVMRERYDSNIRKSVKIPNAVEQINVGCVNLYGFLELVSKNNFQMKP